MGRSPSTDCRAQVVAEHPPALRALVPKGWLPTLAGITFRLKASSLFSVFFFFPFQREEDGRDQLLVCPQEAALQEGGSSADP